MNIDNPKIRKIVFEKYGGRCAYCGCELNARFSIDHIVPKLRGDINKGGPDSISNYNPSCFSCNSSKSTLSLDKWRANIINKIIQLNRDSATYRTAKRFGLVKETGKNVEFYFERYV